jgi:hypothetical protein
MILSGFQDLGFIREGGGGIISILGLFKELFFCVVVGQSKMPISKEKHCTLGIPKLTKMNYTIVLYTKYI